LLIDLTPRFNSGTHMAQLVEPWPLFLLLLDDNARNLKNDSISIGLFFIEDFIFLVKKKFLTKFEKLALERNFDLH
jgi:hypothetical protein